jgi:hypothetical protein
LCCFERYEQCSKGQNLAVPAKKAKIYAYLEALLGTTETEKKKIKEEHRDYSNKQRRNLDSNCLEPLKNSSTTAYFKNIASFSDFSFYPHYQKRALAE